MVWVYRPVEFHQQLRGRIKVSLNLRHAVRMRTGRVQPGAGRRVQELRMFGASEDREDGPDASAVQHRRTECDLQQFDAFVVAAYAIQALVLEYPPLLFGVRSRDISTE